MPRKHSKVSLSAIKPPLDVPDVASFEYPQLETVVERNFKDEYEAIDEVFERYDADDEESLETRLSHEYLLLTALRLQQADSDEDRALWSRRYTQVSIEVFGQPQASEAAAIAVKELEHLESKAQAFPLERELIEPVLSAYRSLTSLHYDDSAAKDHGALLDDVNEIMEAKFSDVYELIDERASDVLTVDEIRELFSDIVNLLDWTSWRVTIDNTAQMSVSPRRRTINIGAYIPPLSRQRVRGLLTHEVLTHAYRAINGSELDRVLAYGLPGYITAEEGLAVLLETAVTGRLPDRIGDRYIDITLALGTSDSEPMSRFDMYRLTVGRTLLRLGRDASRVDRSMVRRLAWQHVNRIYRGSLGNEFVGVFTKDAAYYRGYQQMATYLSRYQGGQLERALDFVLSGKFDPTKPTHRLYVHSRRFNAEYELEDAG